ncbi:DUF3298 and DUF4163 domain-containing protein [Psychroserpens sp. MEBiC05023]
MFNRIPNIVKKSCLLFVILISLISCKKEITIDFIETQIETSETAEIALNFPKAEGTETIANPINATLENYIVTQINFSEDIPSQLTIDDAISKFNYEFISFKNEFPDAGKKWEVFVDGEVTYRSPEVISIAINSYLDTGGAHGNTRVKFFNFNPQTGDLIDINDILKNKEAFSKVVSQKLKEDIASNSNNDALLEDLFFGEKFQLPESLGYSDEGIIILYNTYEIASYSQGIVEFTIPFEEINSFLNIN